MACVDEVFVAQELAKNSWENKKSMSYKVKLLSILLGLWQALYAKIPFRLCSSRIGSVLRV
jgi:hypothetical protein